MTQPTPAPRLCPCGRPARRKYCSEKCANRYYARHWRSSSGKAAAYMAKRKVLYKQWARQNKDKLRAYQRAYQRTEKRQAALERYYRKNRAKILARRRAEYHADPHRKRDAINKAWALKHKAEIAAKAKARRDKDRAKYRRISLSSYYRHRAAALARRRARKRKLAAEKAALEASLLAVALANSPPTSAGPSPTSPPTR